MERIHQTLQFNSKFIESQEKKVKIYLQRRKERETTFEQKLMEHNINDQFKLFRSKSIVSGMLIGFSK